MTEETSLSNRQDHELSMDEILSSIRNIINEDQDKRPESKRTFPEESTTNPAGARMMGDLPAFDHEDDFVLPNFKEEELKARKAEPKEKRQTSVFPDEGFETKHRNERSFQEQSEPYYQQEQFARDANATEDKISRTLKAIVESYAKKHTPYQESEVERSLEYGSHTSRLSDYISTMIEKIIVIRVEEWLQRHLPGILEKAILKELERVLHQMKI